VEHSGGIRLWKILSFTVAVPGVLLCWLNAKSKEAEHHGKERPEFVHYDHLRRRTKKFPWGDGNHSLFHNRKANALPDGYED
jgi:cytochrome c oxidase subunit 6a